jgi:hypothetical protein
MFLEYLLLLTENCSGNILLDSGKTGHRLGPGVAMRHGQKYPFDSDNKQPRADVLNRLVGYGKELKTDLLRRYDLAEKQGASSPVYDCGDNDQDLLSPYFKVHEKYKGNLRDAKRIKALEMHEVELNNIEAHVRAAFELFKTIVGGNSKSKRSQEYEQAKKGKAAAKDRTMIPVIRAYRQPIKDIFFMEETVERVKASFAYSLNVNFAFTVAFHELCSIKTAASPGGGTPTIGAINCLQSFTKASRRWLQQTQPPFEA